MKAYELMALAEREPEKYKNKKYNVKNSCCMGPSGKSYKNIVIDDEGRLHGDNYDNWAYINSNCIVEEIQQPVTFMEAVNSGKDFRPERWGPCSDDKEYRNLYENLKMFEGRECVQRNIINGEWYIKP